MKRYYYYDTAGNRDVKGPVFINEIDSKIYDGSITDQCLVALEGEVGDESDQVWVPYYDLDVERAKCLSCGAILLGGPQAKTWNCNKCNASNLLSFLLAGPNGYNETIKRLKSDLENGISFLQMSADLRFQCEERFKVLIKTPLEKWSICDVQLYGLWPDYPGRENFYEIKRQFSEESEMRKLRKQLKEINHNMSDLARSSRKHKVLLEDLLSSLGAISKGTNTSALHALREMHDM